MSLAKQVGRGFSVGRRVKNLLFQLADNMSFADTDMIEEGSKYWCVNEIFEYSSVNIRYLIACPERRRINQNQFIV